MSGSAIPPALLLFLAAYPHPAFALEAKPLHQALITRASIGQDTSREDEVQVVVRDEDTNSPASRDRAAAVADHAPVPLSTPPVSGSKSFHTSQGSKTSGQTKTSSSTRSGPAPAPQLQGLSTNDRILSSAFNAHPSTDDTSPGFHPSPSSYLEGGEQKSHDASRTAEGAVRSMLQQAETEGKRQQKVHDDVQNGRAKAQIASDASWGGMDRGTDTDAADTMGSSRQDRGVGKSLAELLSPAWANDKWRALVSTGDEKPDLGLLALLSREGAQLLMALLVDAVESFSLGGIRRSGAKENPSFTCNLPLSFPPTSVHHPSNAMSGCAARSADDPNAYRHASRLHFTPAQSTLDIVVTLVPSTDLIILTTILKLDNMTQTLPPTLTRANPYSPVGTRSDSPATSTPPRDDSPHSVPTRSPITHQTSDPASMGTSSSSETVRNLSSSTIMSFNSSTTSTSLGEAYAPSEFPISLDVPLPTDHIPVPFPSADEIPFAGPTVGTTAPPTDFPRGFAVEKPKRRRRAGGRKGALLGLEEIREPDANGEQERTEEQDKTQGRKERHRRELEDGEDSSEEAGSGETSEDDDAQADGPPDNLNALVEDSRIREMFLSEATAAEGPDFNDTTLAGPIVRQTPTPSHLQFPHFPPPSDDPFYNVLSRTPMGRRIAAYPWESSPLGAIAAWSREIRVVVSLMLASPFRCSLWLGPSSVILYNDEYIKVAGEKHPALLGKSGADGWAELWDTLGPLAARVMTGETVSFYDHSMPMYRSGYLEETYQMWSYVPFRGEDSQILGYENFSVETTARVIAERRLGTIRDLVLLTARARTVEQYCQQTLQSLEGNPFDLPFALLYTCEINPAGGGPPTKSSESGRSHSVGEPSSSASTIRLTLQGTVGVPADHPSAPAKTSFKVDLTAATLSAESDASSTTSNTDSNMTGSTDAAPSSTTYPFRDAFTRKRPIFIQELAGRTTGYTARGWPDAPRNAVCIPILVEDDTVSFPRAILVVGLNPRRPWNEVYATFLHLLSRQIATGLFSVASAEQDFRRAEELLQLDRAKSAFFSNVSHELRTPLTLMIGPLQDVLAAKENLLPEDRKQLVHVQKNSTRLLNMVNSLLDFSRIETGRGSMVFRPTRISQLTVDLTSLFRSAIERGGVDFIVDAEPDPPDGRLVFLSPELWEKVVFNLCGNAFKYTLSGSITCRIRFSASEVTIDFIDTGCGIADADLGRIFERFHRVESTARSREGTGIGLALTLELVKTLGGVLDVTSQHGHGSTFTVRIPRGSAHLPPAQVSEAQPEAMQLPARAARDLSIIQEAESWKVDSSLPPTSHHLSPSESARSSDDDHFLQSADLLNLGNSIILLVDDNEDLRAYVGSVLRKAFRVVECRDGQEALDYCMKSPPDLVVTDIMMPRLDGPGLLAALRDNPKTASLPLIFLSAKAGPEARIEALTSGADDYLVKPFQSRELVARVNVHLQLGKLRKELEKRVDERTRALIESEMRYRGLADRYSALSLLSPVGVFLCDADGTLTYANPRFYDISSYSPDGPLAQWPEAILPDDRAAVERLWNEAIAVQDGVPKLMEFRFAANRNWVQLELRSFRENNTKRGFVGSVTDITRAKHIEALHLTGLQQRAQDAEENTRQKDLYIDSVSHELRNPLSGVWQNAELLRESLSAIQAFFEDAVDGEYPEKEEVETLLEDVIESVEAVDSIILCALHQGRIVDDVLNVSRLDMNLLTIAPTPFAVEARVNEVLKMFEVECSQQRIDLRLAKGPGVQRLGASWVVADHARVAQILLNFLSNSIKFTSESTAKRITVHLDALDVLPPRPQHGIRIPDLEKTLQPGEVWLVIAVADSGRGLTEDDLTRLFNRFSQAHPKTDQYGGSGLGLYVSKKLVELHGGFLQVESELGKGSKFTLALPVPTAPAPLLSTPPLSSQTSRLGISSHRAARTSSQSGSPRLAPVSPFPSPPSVQAPPPPAAPPTPQPAIRVLLVEDNLVNQRVLTRQMKMKGYVVEVANHGREALDILLDAETAGPPAGFDVILMDIEMPVMGGLECIQKVRQLETTKEISTRYPVVCVTGNARPAQVQSYRDAGFDDIAIKPYDFKKLSVLIEKLAGR